MVMHFRIAAALLLFSCLSTSAADKPNILYILADDLGYGDVHALNPKRGKIATPHLDRLAAEGMVFTDAHSGSSVCTPTRYGILTGRYAWRSSLVSGVLGGMSPPLIEPGRLTVAAMLKGQGYHTACIGKWHLGLGWAKWDDPAERKKHPGWPHDFSKPLQQGPTARGFDTFYGISASLDMPPYAWIDNDRLTALPTASKTWIREGPADPAFEAVDVLPGLTRKAVELINGRKQDDKPIFLYLPLASPHTPILPTAEWKGKSGLGDYGDFVMQTDACVGEILDALEKSGLAENTLIVFTSDNGCSPAAEIEALEKQGHFPHGELRGTKADIWEGGHRVPFLVRWPAKVKAGTSSNSLVCLTDLMATAAELSGATLPDNAAEDSFSFLADLSGSGKTQRRSIVHHSIHGQFAIREGSWKLAFCPGSGGWSKPGDKEARAAGMPALQLYDLAKDIGEKENLQASRPDQVQRLTGVLEEIVAKGRSTPGPNRDNDKPVDFRKARP